MLETNFIHSPIAQNTSFSPSLSGTYAIGEKKNFNEYKFGENLQVQNITRTKFGAKIVSPANLNKYGKEQIC